MTWKEFVDYYLDNGPKNCTWVTVSDWVEKTYSEEQIIYVLEVLWIELCKDTQSKESDEIRDAMDIFWRAAPNDVYRNKRYPWNRKE